MNAAALKAYRDSLDEYHGKLLDCCHLAAHLLDLVIDMDVPEWQRSGCHLMREQLVDLAENLPFPLLEVAPDSLLADNTHYQA